jgi:hypothetical protein
MEQNVQKENRYLFVSIESSYLPTFVPLQAEPLLEEGLRIISDQSGAATRVRPAELAMVVSITP